jgi:hypothetical protein
LSNTRAGMDSSLWLVMEAILRAGRMSVKALASKHGSTVA